MFGFLLRQIVSAVFEHRMPMSAQERAVWEAERERKETERKRQVQKDICRR